MAYAYGDRTDDMASFGSHSFPPIPNLIPANKATSCFRLRARDKRDTDQRQIQSQGQIRGINPAYFSVEHFLCLASYKQSNHNTQKGAMG